MMLKLHEWSHEIWSKNYYVNQNTFFSNSMLSLSNFCKLKFNCFTFSNSSENIAILCTLLSKAIRFLPVNFLFDNKILIFLLESLFSSLFVNFNWNDCNWEFEISIYLKSGYLSFAFGERLEKGACDWKCESYLLDCAQKISTPFGSNYFTFILEVASIDH
jgi:hypothetical protein